MRLTDALLGEHGAFYALFDQVEALADTGGDVVQTQSAALLLNALVGSHATLEEELLFSALDAHPECEEPLTVMRREHSEIERALELIEDAQDLAQAQAGVRHALSIARSHFRKEELVLFRLARQVLGDEKLAVLGEDWARSRQVALG